MIPKPLRTDYGPGSFEWDGVAIKSAPEGWEGLVTLADHCLGKGSLPLHMAYNEGIPESYEIQVQKQGIEVRCADYPGAVWALQTLRQWAKDRTNVPEGVVKDAPRFGWRGFMLDSARHFQRFETVLSLIDRLSELKINRFHWHLTDDSAWRIEIGAYPELTEIGAFRSEDEPESGGFYTHKQARELVRYARERGIEVVPEIEMPGHATAALFCHPELTCRGKPWQPLRRDLGWFLPESGRQVFSAGKEDTFKFIEHILDEIAQVFDAQFVHIGGDERREGVWAACDDCQRRMAEEGLRSEAELQAWFVNRVATHLRSLGKTAVCWLPSLEGNLPKEAILQDWFYDLTAQAMQLGYKVLNTKDRRTYLDYPDSPGMAKPSWMPDLSTEEVYGFDPMPPDMEEPQLMLGSSASLWTEYVEEEDLLTRMFPRLFAFSEVVWSDPKDRDWNEFKSRMNYIVKPLLTKPKEEAITNMYYDARYGPDKAFDGKGTTWFASLTAPAPGAFLETKLPKSIDVKEIRVLTGCDDRPDDVLVQGTLWLCINNQWIPAGSLSGWRTVLLGAFKDVTAIRLVVDSPQPRPLVVRGVRWS